MGIDVNRTSTPTARCIRSTGGGGELSRVSKAVAGLAGEPE